MPAEAPEMTMLCGADRSMREAIAGGPQRADSRYHWGVAQSNAIHPRALQTAHACGGCMSASTLQVNDIEGGALPAVAVTTFAFERLLGQPRGPSMRATHDACVVELSGEMILRPQCMAHAGRVSSHPLRGRVSACQPGLRRLAGHGTFIYDGSGNHRYVLLALKRDVCGFVEPSVVGLESRLLSEFGVVPGTRHDGPIKLVRVFGEGRVLLALTSDVLTLRVHQSAPVTVRRGQFLGWVGSVIPRQDAANALNLRCEGEGAVFVALQRGFAFNGRG